MVEYEREKRVLEYTSSTIFHLYIGTWSWIYGILKNPHTFIYYYIII